MVASIPRPHEPVGEPIRRGHSLGKRASPSSSSSSPTQRLQEQPQPQPQPQRKVRATTTPRPTQPTTMKRRRIELESNDTDVVVASSKVVKERARKCDKIPVIVSLIHEDANYHKVNNEVEQFLLQESSPKASSSTKGSFEPQKSLLEDQDFSSFHANSIIRKVVTNEETSCQETVAMFCRDIIENVTTNQWLFSICNQFYQQQGKQDLDLTISYGNGYITKVLLRQGADGSSNKNVKQQAALSVILKLKQSKSSIMMSPNDSIWNQLSSITSTNDATTSSQFNPTTRLELRSIPNRMAYSSNITDGVETTSAAADQYHERKTHVLLLTMNENGKLGAAKVIHPRQWSKLGITQYTYKKIPVIVDLVHRDGTTSIDKTDESTSSLPQSSKSSLDESSSDKVTQQEGESSKGLAFPAFPSFPMSPIRKVINDTQCPQTVAMFCKDIIENMSTNQWLFDVCDFYLQKEDSSETTGSGYNRQDLDLIISYGHGYYTKVMLKDGNKNDENEKENLENSHNETKKTQCQQAFLSISLKSQHADSSTVLTPIESIWEHLLNVRTLQSVSSSHSTTRLELQFNTHPANAKTPSILIQDTIISSIKGRDQKRRHEIILTMKNNTIERSETKLWTIKPAIEETREYKKLPTIISLVHKNASDNRSIRGEAASNPINISPRPGLPARIPPSSTRRQEAVSGAKAQSSNTDPIRKVISNNVHDRQTVSTFCRDIVENVTTNQWLFDICCQCWMNNHGGSGGERHDLNVTISYGLGHFTVLKLKSANASYGMNKRTQSSSDNKVKQVALSVVLKLQHSDSNSPTIMSAKDLIWDQVSSRLDSTKSPSTFDPLRLEVHVISHLMIGTGPSSLYVNALSTMIMKNHGHSRNHTICVTMNDSGIVDTAMIVHNNATRRRKKLVKNKKKKASSKKKSIRERPPSRRNSMDAPSFESNNDSIDEPIMADLAGNTKDSSRKRAKRSDPIDKNDDDTSNQDSRSSPASNSMTEPNSLGQNHNTSVASKESCQDRTLTIRFCSLNTNERFRSIRIVLDSLGLVADLEHIILKRLSYTNSNIILAEERNDDLYFLNLSDSINIVKDDHSILAFQVPTRTLIQYNLRKKEIMVNKALGKDIKELESCGRQFDLSEEKKTMLDPEEEWMKTLQSYLVVPLFMTCRSSHEEKLALHRKLSAFLSECYRLSNDPTNDVDDHIRVLCEKNSDTLQKIKCAQDVATIRFCSNRFYGYCITDWLKKLVKTRSEIGEVHVWFQKEIRPSQSSSSSIDERVAGPPLILRVSCRLTIFGLRSLLAQRIRRAIQQNPPSGTKLSLNDTVIFATHVMRQVPLSYQNKQIGSISRRNNDIAESDQIQKLASDKDEEERKCLLQVVPSRGKVVVHWPQTSSYNEAEWSRVEAL